MRVDLKQRKIWDTLGHVAILLYDTYNHFLSLPANHSSIAI